MNSRAYLKLPAVAIMKTSLCIMHTVDAGPDKSVAYRHITDLQKVTPNESVRHSLSNSK